MPIGIHTVDFDLRIATERLDSRESEFPPTPESVKIILKSTIISEYPIINPKVPLRSTQQRPHSPKKVRAE